MEDKWFIYTDGPDASGAATVNFHRSWTGEKVAELTVEVAWGEDSAAELWRGSIVKLTMESDMEGLSEDSTEEFVKFQVLEVCNWVLGIQLVDKIKGTKVLGGAIQDVCYIKAFNDAANHISGDQSFASDDGRF